MFLNMLKNLINRSKIEIIIIGDEGILIIKNRGWIWDSKNQYQWYGNSPKSAEGQEVKPKALYEDKETTRCKEFPRIQKEENLM